MLGQAIGGLLPLAVGVALSPIPIIAVILMLGTPKARSNGPAFAVGWVAGLVIVNVIVLVVAGGSSTAGSTSSTTQDWLKIVLGVLFLALAGRQWRGRQPGEEPTMPGWMATIDSFTAGKSFWFGILLSGVNPKNLALTLAAASSIAQAGLSGSQTAIAVLVFVVIGSLTVAGPVIYYLVAAATAAKPLASIKQFMSDHNAVIMMVLFLVLGAKLIGDGIAGLG
jgi:threonine/homoserine/homoserine lactone efflux protein